MAPLGFLTAERFEQKYGDKKPFFEYWYGEAVKKPFGDEIHSLLQGIIGLLLRQRGWRVGIGVRLKISHWAFPLPDLSANRNRPLGGPYPTEAVDLCVEVVSPDDSLRKLFTKGAHYLDWGIGTVWIVDGEYRRAFIMTLEHPKPVEIGLADSLTAGSGEDAAEISMRELFNELDKDLS